MKGNRAAVAAVLAIVLIAAAWWVIRRGSAGEPVDLLAQWESAEKRPSPEIFTVRDVALGGESKRAIVITPSPGTRLIWKVRVPDDAWLRIYVGLLPEVWEQEGDGVLFRVGVSAGGQFEDLVQQHVDPFKNKGDRKWISMMVDLSTYAGEDVELILNTNASLPGPAPDARNDAAVWGAPEIVIR
jgi:hypothetical protein